jgi:hypothetical protein
VSRDRITQLQPFPSLVEIHLTPIIILKDTVAGNALKLYSATNTDHGPFSVSLDDADAIKLTGASSDFRPKTLLVCTHHLSEV